MISTYPCKLFAFPGLHLVQISGFFRSVPSPEHGASHKILSNFNNEFPGRKK